MSRTGDGLPVLMVVIHDVAPATWPACRRLIAAIDEVARIPLTLLVVPNYHHLGWDPVFERELEERRRRGDELALHGYTHRDDQPCRGIRALLTRRLYTRGEGEFSALDHVEAMSRLKKGLDWFAARRWPVAGFVAPAWLLNAPGWNAVRRLPFRYTATLGRLHVLPDGPALRSQAMVYSCTSAWRRIFSLAWVRLLLALQGRPGTASPIARVELHPYDADYPAIRNSLQHLVASLLRDRMAVTACQALQLWAKARANSHRR